MVLKFWILIAGCFMVSCLRYKPNKLFREPYMGSEMRVDGYYSNMGIIERDTATLRSEVTVLLFFRNGFMTSSTFLDTDFDTIEKEISKTRNPYPFLEGSGHFQVKGKELTVEFWTHVSYSPIPTARVPGKIVNDTTIQCLIYGRTESDLWHFRPLSVKPDSTTIYDEQLKTGKSFKGYIGKPGKGE